ncbi:hypothetical protein Trydic_g4170 [Trypoxylus dichotomus]
MTIIYRLRNRRYIGVTMIFYCSGNIAAKPVTRKPKTPGKSSKIPAAVSRPKPAPKKLETPKPGKPTRTAIPKKPVPDVPRTSTARTETDAMSTLAMLIPLFQRINWTKVQEVATTLLPQLLACRSGAEAGLVENARGGGIAILVKSTIEHHADLALDLTNIEATAVTVNLATGPVKLFAAYKAPNKQLLEDDLSEIFDTRRAVILTGDFNARHPSWNSRRTNASGTCLRRFADDLHLLVDATAEPMIYPHNGQPDVLDIVSDHNQVLLQPGQAAPEDEDPPDAPDGVVARFHGSPLRPQRSYHGDRRPDRARSSSTPSHGARIRQRTVRNQYLAYRRRQGLHPQASPRPDTGEEPAPKTMAENVKPG